LKTSEFYLGGSLSRTDVFWGEPVLETQSDFTLL
jgi:hypothetical protein